MDDPQRELKEWLAEKVRPHGEARRLAEATGLSSDKITRSKELEATDPKKRRTLQYEEIRSIAMFYRELPPGYEGMKQWLRDADASPRTPSRVVPSYDPDEDAWPGEAPQSGAAIVEGKLFYRRKFDGGSPETSATPGAGFGPARRVGAAHHQSRPPVGARGRPCLFVGRAQLWHPGSGRDVEDRAAE